MDQKLYERVMQAIRERVFPGCVIGILDSRGVRRLFPFGAFTYESDSPRVTEESIYDCASLTKVLPTASLAAILIDQGNMSLSDRLIQYVPEFRNSYRDMVEIHHLLDYTLAYDTERLSSFRDRTSEELLNYIFTRELKEMPGTSVQSSNTAPFLLGLAIERIMGSSLDALADEYFFAPLRMQSSTLTPEIFPIEKIVPTEIVEGRGLVWGQVHDESAYVLRIKGGMHPGQAGLFSTAPDILSFLETILHGPEKMRLGWDARDASYTGATSGRRTFGKTGFTGTVMCCDPDRGRAFVLLSNRTFPQRPRDSAAINAVRHDVADIVWGSTLSL